MDFKDCIVLFCLLFTGIALKAQQPVPMQENMDSVKKAMALQKKAIAKLYGSKKISYLITKAGNKEFGYYIFADGQMLIDQKTIPAIQGNHGFKTSKDAQAVVALAIKKIKQGEMPPTINVAELKKLKIAGVK